MKTQFKPMWLFFLVGLTIASCNQEAKKSRESLTVNKFLSDDASELTLVETLAEIDKDIEIVKEKSEIIELNANLNDEGKNEEIVLKNISMVNSIMDENREKIEELKEQLDNSKSTNMDLFQLSKLTNDKLEQQEIDFENLKVKLNRKNYQLEDLNRRMSIVALENAKMSDLIAQLETKVNTGYYAVDTYKNLKDKEIVEKEGGIIGFRAVKSINEDFNQDEFKEVNIVEVTKVKVDSKKAKLITEHPSDSYEFKKSDNKVDYLKILNPEEFWKTSKYLIVETK